MCCLKALHSTKDFRIKSTFAIENQCTDTFIEHGLFKAISKVPRETESFYVFLYRFS